MRKLLWDCNNDSEMVNACLFPYASNEPLSSKWGAGSEEGESGGPHSEFFV